LPFEGGVATRRPERWEFQVDHEKRAEKWKKGKRGGMPYGGGKGGKEVRGSKRTVKKVKKKQG